MLSFDQDRSSLTFQKVYSKALALLARREYSEKNLRKKMIAKFPESNQILEEVISRLKNENFLNDERYLGAYIVHCTRRGLGLHRILQALSVYHLTMEQLKVISENQAIDWQEIISTVIRKRMRLKPLKTSADHYKLKQFLVARGFTESQIESALKREICNE